MVRCMDSGSGNEQRAVPGERATLTLTSSHILQDVSWASSPRAPSKGPGLQHFSSEDEEGEGEPVWPTSIWNHSSAPGTASKSSLPGLLLRGHSSKGVLAQSSVSGQQSIIDFQSVCGKRRWIVQKSCVFGFEMH